MNFCEDCANYDPDGCWCDLFECEMEPDSEECAEFDHKDGRAITV